MYAFLRRYLPRKAVVIVLAMVYAVLIAMVFMYAVGVDAEFRYIDI